jgi:recombination protein RecT
MIKERQMAENAEVKKQEMTALQLATKSIITKLNAWLPKIISVSPDPELAKRAIGVLASMVRNDASLAKCTPNSVLVCAYNIAKIGLNPDKQLGQVWCIPYKGILTMQVGYKGYIVLAKNGGGILECAELIHANDTLEYWITEHGTHFKWQPWYLIGKDDPGVLIGGFTSLKTDGGTVTRIVPIKELNRRRGLSQAFRSNKKDSPWFVHPESMYLVTTIRANAKLWALDTVQRAIKIDEDAEEGRPQIEAEDAEFLEISAESLQQSGDDGNGNTEGITPAAALVAEIKGIKEMMALDSLNLDVSKYSEPEQKIISQALVNKRRELEPGSSATEPAKTGKAPVLEPGQTESEYWLQKSIYDVGRRNGWSDDEVKAYCQKYYGFAPWKLNDGQADAVKIYIRQYKSVAFEKPEKPEAEQTSIVDQAEIE